MSSQNTTNLTYSPTLLLLEKHITLFQSNTYILKLERDEDFFNLWAINIRTLRRVLTENIDLLKNCLGQQVDIESLISRLSDNKEKIADVLGQHHLLYGLSFGYGRENSILFHHRAFLEEILNEELLPPFLPDSDSLTRLHHILDSDANGFYRLHSKSHPFFINREQVEKKLNAIQNRMQFITDLYKEHENTDLVPVHLPPFVGDIASEETETIAQDFLNTRRTLENVLYSSESLCEAVFNQIHR